MGGDCEEVSMWRRGARRIEITSRYDGQRGRQSEASVRHLGIRGVKKARKSCSAERHSQKIKGRNGETERMEAGDSQAPLEGRLMPTGFLFYRVLEKTGNLDAHAIQSRIHVMDSATRLFWPTACEACESL